MLHAFAQEREQNLRRILYRWRHMRGDMIINDFITCPLVIHSTAFGITEDVDIIRMDAASDIVSHHFHRQIYDFPDLEKIKMPALTYDPAATEYRYRALCDIYAGIMPVRKTGQTHIRSTPWDYLIRWWGIEDAVPDMVQRPDLAFQRFPKSAKVELRTMGKRRIRVGLCGSNRCRTSGRLGGAPLESAGRKTVPPGGGGAL